MDTSQSISDAGLYTDFNGLQKLRAKISGSAEESQQATKEVAEQFESLFLQMMLKSMRDATITGDSEESDQTRFYQEMFDKQIALDLANNKGGAGIGIASAIERDITGKQPQNIETQKAENNLQSIRQQLNMSSALSPTNSRSEQG